MTVLDSRFPPADWRGDADLPEPDPDDPRTHWRPAMPDLTDVQFRAAAIAEGFTPTGMHGWWNLGVGSLNICACIDVPSAGKTNRDRLAYLRLQREHWERHLRPSSPPRNLEEAERYGGHSAMFDAENRHARAYGEC